MSIPSSTYDIATISNPSAALTDFSLIVDLSNMSSAWWAAVDTTDGTKGRAAKGDGTTELACDWIDFDNGSETGLVRIKWTGTLATTGTQEVEIYPPQAANASYAATDTYGQYNAYNSNWIGYWPLQSDANDRTSTQNNGTAQGGATVGGVSGKIGNATSFDGIDDWIELSTVFASGAADFEIDLWYKGTDGDNQYFGQGLTTSNNPRLLFMHQSSYYKIVGATAAMAVATTDDIDDSWRNLVANSTNIYIDSTSRVSGSDYIQAGTYDNAGIGTFNRNGSLYQPTQGNIQDVKAFNSSRSDAERSQEYIQVSDNATFWGTWTNVTSGSTYNESYSESITLAETQSSTMLLPLSISEGLSLSETQNIIATFIIGLSESIGMSESQDGSFTIEIGISESIGLSELEASIGAFALSIAESMGVSDICTSGDLTTGKLSVTISSNKSYVNITATKTDISISATRSKITITGV